MFPPPVSVMERVKFLPIHVWIRVDRCGYTDADSCTYHMQVNGLPPFTDTGKRSQMQGDGQVYLGL